MQAALLWISVFLHLNLDPIAFLTQTQKENCGLLTGAAMIPVETIFAPILNFEITLVVALYRLFFKVGTLVVKLFASAKPNFQFHSALF